MGGPAHVLVFSAHGANFVKTMLGWANARNCASLPTSMAARPRSRPIAAACLTMVRAMGRRRRGGIYHLPARPTRHGPVLRARSWRRPGLPAGSPILQVDYPPRRGARRILRLDCAAIGRDFGIARPTGGPALPKCCWSQKPMTNPAMTSTSAAASATGRHHLPAARERGFIRSPWACRKQLCRSMTSR